MNISDIFDEVESKAYVSEHKQRFNFTISDQCRLYHYDKTIGVRLGVFFDHVDYDVFDEEAPTNVVSENTYGFLEDLQGLQMSLKVYALNFDNNQYEQLDLGEESAFPLENKRYFSKEILLQAQHLNQDGEIQLVVKFVIGDINYAQYGFLGRKTKLVVRSFEPGKVELKTKLVAERNYPNTQNSNPDDSENENDLNWTDF